MRQKIAVIAKLLILLACIAYLVHGADFSQLLRIAARFDTFKIGCVFIWIALGFSIMGLRLAFLAGFGRYILPSVEAAYFCFFVNNVVPARVGEVAKAYYLSRRTELPLSRGLELVFWERFADLNVFLVLMLFALMATGQRILILPFAVLTGVIWGFVILLFLRPEVVPILLKAVPTDRFKRFMRSFMEHLQKRGKTRFFLMLLLFTSFVWMQHLLELLLIIFWVADLPIDIGQAMVVFVMAVTALSLPLAPAGLGVMETAIVFSLGLFGIGHNEALAVGLLWHLLQYLVTFGIAVVLLLSGGIHLKNWISGKDTGNAGHEGMSL